jgi:uncharacterized protein YndB with AHSA1/START domain
MTEASLPRVDSGSRLIAASPHTVYSALIDGEAVAKWLPPSEMTGRLLEFDPRPGGAFRMELTFNDKSHATAGKTSADSDMVEGHFVRLIPDREIVQRFTFRSDDPTFAGEMTITWSFAAEGTGTRVTVAATHVPPGISPKDHQTGLTSSLANLAAYTE